VSIAASFQSMALATDRHQVRLVIRAAVRLRHNVIELLGFRNQALCSAQLTERPRFEDPVPALRPRPVIPSTRRRSSARVGKLGRTQVLVLLTPATSHESRTAVFKARS